MHLVVARGEVEGVRLGNVFAAQHCVVEVRDAAARLVVELLRLHIPERAEEHFAVFAVKAVDAAVAHEDGGDGAVFELVEPRAVEARRDEVQHVAVHLERLTAAVADVAADGRTDGLAVDGVGRDGKRCIVELVEVAVGIHAELAVGGGEQQEGRAEGVLRDDKVGAALGDGLFPARGKVHAVKVRAAKVRGAGAGDVKKAVVNGLLILRELNGAHAHALGGQAGEGLLFRVVVEKALIRAAGVGAAVPPPGELLDDLIVLVFLLVIKVGLDKLFVALVEFLKAREGRANGEQIAARQGIDGGHGNGEGESKLRLAAVERDPIKAALERGLLLALTVARKEHGVFVEIAEGGFLTTTGQRTDDAVFERIEAGIIAVFFFFCLAHGEAGGRSLGGKRHVRQRANGAEIINGDGSHGTSSFHRLRAKRAKLCEHHTTATNILQSAAKSVEAHKKTSAETADVHKKSLDFSVSIW